MYHCFIKKKLVAFTLAEVLITLGIIGVVAALTMPALIANHRKQVTVTKLKKVYSVMNQAISAAVAEYGDAENWAAECGISTAPLCTTEEAMNWFQTYIGKNLQTTKMIKNPDSNTRFLVYLKDGSILNIANFIHDIEFYTDGKALKNPKAGVNYFIFRFNPVLTEGQDAEKNKYSVKASFEPYVWSWDGTRDGLIHTGNGYGCGEQYNSFCAKLIQYEGWQIPKDYPIRF